MSNHEELLLTLMSMGFDYEKCAVVLENGVTNVEDAIQKLVNPAPIPSTSAFNTNNQIPEIVAEPNQSSQGLSQGESSKVKSRFERQRKEQADFERKEARNIELVKKKQKFEERKVKQNLLKEIEDDRKRHKKNEEHIDKPAESSSNKDVHKMSDKEEFEKKEREALWKKMQMEKRMEKQRVLEKLQQDKLNKKGKVGLKTAASTAADDDGDDEHATIQSSLVKKSSSCRIQVVFSSGPNQCFNLPAETKLLELFVQCVKEESDGEKKDYYFLQTFPKKMFTIAESENSLQELGLYPSARLLLKKTDTETIISTQGNSEASTINTSTQDDNIGIATTSSTIDNADAAVIEGMKTAGNHMTETTQGDSDNHQQVILDRIEVEASEISNVNNAEDVECHLNVEPEVSIKLDKQDQDRRLHSRLLQGEFVNIINDINNVDLDYEVQAEVPCAVAVEPHHVLRAQLFQEAIERRLLDNNDVQHFNLKHKTFTLQILVAKFIATQMSRKEPRIVDFMWKLNPQAASVLVKTLKSTNKVTVDALDLLKQCKLQEINLDLCRFTSLDVILSLKMHHHLKRISLKSVTCVTDRAVETILKNSPHVTYLNLSQCDALVGSFLVSKLGLSKLKTLILDETKIKSEYIKSFLRVKPAKLLTQLSLNYCTIKNEAFDLVEEYPSLKILSMNHTSITSLSFLSYCPNLIGLAVKSLPVANEEILHVGDLKDLTWLDLQGTNISYNGLRHIKGKRLTHLTLPDRLCVDNRCLTVIEGFHLASLDLSDYIHLDDECMKSIFNMENLCTLSMSNTKITDEGARKIEKLTRLEALDISRTNVTSNISSIFQGLKYLETLNVSRTNITNEFLSGLNCCHLLAKLSISNTQIGDEGIRVLKLPKLSTIIADATGVTMDAVRSLKRSCPMLSLVRNVNEDVNYTRDLVQ